MKKPKLKLKIKITPRKLTFWFYFIVLIASLAVFTYLGFFLYEDFYQTITQSKEIVVLKEKVAIETIDVNKFDTIVEKIKQKTTLRQIEKLYNPFD